MNSTILATIAIAVCYSLPSSPGSAATMTSGYVEVSYDDGESWNVVSAAGGAKGSAYKEIWVAGGATDNFWYGVVADEDANGIDEIYRVAYSDVSPADRSLWEGTFGTSDPRVMEWDDLGQFTQVY